jgi:hypothetical protein
LASSMIFGSMSVMLGTLAQIAVVIRPYHNFAPFVRQIGERKAQACAKEIFHQLSHPAV